MKIITGLACLVLGCAVSSEAVAQYVQSGPVITYTPPAAQKNPPIDYQNAKPMPLPTAQTAPPAQGIPVAPSQIFRGPSGGSPGGVGTGVMHPIQLAPGLTDQQLLQQQLQAQPQEFGTSDQPYTTSRANAYYDPTTTYYPFRAAGKLFFQINGANYLCSASLIKPGLVVTAAHCVANYGQSQFYSNWQFVPAYNNGSAPYGVWSAKGVTILTAYYNGQILVTNTASYAQMTLRL